MNNEPVAVSGAIQVLIGAVLTILTAFNVWHPTDAQTAAIFGLFTAVIAVAHVALRPKVTPNSKL